MRLNLLSFAMQVFIPTVHLCSKQDRAVMAWCIHSSHQPLLWCTASTGRRRPSSFVQWSAAFLLPLRLHPSYSVPPGHIQGWLGWPSHHHRRKPHTQSAVALGARIPVSWVWRGDNLWTINLILNMYCKYVCICIAWDMCNYSVIFLIWQVLHIPDIDWESSGLAPSVPNSGIHVPEIECPLSPEEFAQLQGAVDPLSSRNLGVDTYLAALQYMQGIGYRWFFSSIHLPFTNTWRVTVIPTVFNKCNVVGENALSCFFF